MSHADAESTARAVQSGVESFISSKYVVTRAERCQKIVTENSAEKLTTCTKMLRKQRWLQRISCSKIKDIQFPQCKICNNFKAKKQSSQKTETCEYKIDTGSDSNPVPIRMSNEFSKHKHH